MALRLMQHKREAFWFYRYLSIFYDKLVNPLFWTEPMRDASLAIGQLDEPGIRVIDVGSGTGFTTEGIVKYVPAGQVTCVDQSPHQMGRARKKSALQDCTFRLGDAENIPAETDSFDRYVSAGSIEYWPNPQLGLMEAYRVIKPGGLALMIGPLEPEQAFSRFVANTWMLFPKDEEYKRYFREAGFVDVEWVYVRPHWIKNDRYGIAIVGRKPAPGKSPKHDQYAATEPSSPEAEPWSLGRRLQLFGRVLIGSIAGFVFIPMALVGYLTSYFRRVDGPRQPLNGYQIGVVALLVVAIGALIWSLF
jgi:MPBQ/MSBQ methyltransferase